MRKVMAVIRLSPGCRSYYDERTHIRLNLNYRTANIYDGDDITNIVQGLRDKKIYLIQGYIAYRTGDEIEDEMEREYKKRLEKRKHRPPTIIGAADVIIKIYTKFDYMKGVIALDNQQQDITNRIKVENIVDTTKPGMYNLVYTVSDKAGNTATAKRIVTVIDNIAPVFKGVKDKTILVGASFDPYEGVTVTDNVDGVLTGNMLSVSYENAETNEAVDSIDTSKVGKFNVNYSAHDLSNNKTEAHCVITVALPEDTEAPVFSGVEDKTVNINEDFDPMEGVKATDNVDGDVTDKIEVKKADETEEATK